MFSTFYVLYLFVHLSLCRRQHLPKVQSHIVLSSHWYQKAIIIIILTSCVFGVVSIISVFLLFFLHIGRFSMYHTYHTFTSFTQSVSTDQNQNQNKVVWNYPREKKVSGMKTDLFITVILSNVHKVQTTQSTKSTLSYHKTISIGQYASAVTRRN